MLVSAVLVPVLLFCVACGTTVAGQPSPADDRIITTVSPAFVHGTDDGDTPHAAPHDRTEGSRGVAGSYGSNAYP